MRKCDKCGAQNATTHVKTIINGELTEYDLCSACAHKLGYNNVFADMEFLAQSFRFDICQQVSDFAFARSRQRKQQHDIKNIIFHKRLLFFILSVS